MMLGLFISFSARRFIGRKINPRQEKPMCPFIRERRADFML
jgi:hypothetical protein